ncbi:hypothetical protein L596_026084 [Steinernema carpocapsae]|uniref:G-protein coupled receptors family 1 profile domain-containing protein n=1 Tax=Steinernema carpocapsae TaxID=34508 RepID=A0A4U5M0D2_STECR|nr:hypothetical protein L596_026084 [Steinernema carpocapsae]
MAVLNVFIAVDRLYAMRKPFKYNRLYSGLILKISVALILLIFAASFAIYTVTRPDNGHIHGYTFTHFVNRFYQSVIHLCTVGAFLFSMVVTILFLHDFYGFLKRSSNGQMGSYTKSVNAANKIVVYLMAVEFICLVVPNTLEIILRYFFDIRMGNFGPVIHPLFVLYITISSLLFLMSSTKNMKSSPPSPVHPVTMHNWTSGVAGTHSGHLMHHSQK